MNSTAEMNRRPRTFTRSSVLFGVALALMTWPVSAFAFDPFVITSPTAGSSYFLGQDVTVSWTGGDRSWNVSVILNTFDPYGPSYGVTGIASTPNDGEVTFTLPTTHFLPGSDVQTYRFYIQNEPATTGAYTYGEVFTVATVAVDTDDDGVPDDEDAFPHDPLEQSDNDQDGAGDNSDPDDDNDGLSDAEEEEMGTDPYVADSDFDGVNDGDDPFPLNAAVSTFENFTVFLRDVLLGGAMILDSDLKSPNQRRPLQNKLTALIEIFRDIEDAPDAMTATQLILDAIDKLEHDLIPKTDGCYGGNPKNDWVVTCDGQDLLYPELQLLLEALRREL